jgi:hypothetical protein
MTDKESEIFKLALELYIREMTNVRHWGSFDSIDGGSRLEESVGAEEDSAERRAQEQLEVARACRAAAAVFVAAMAEE